MVWRGEPARTDARTHRRPAERQLPPAGGLGLPAASAAARQRRRLRPRREVVGRPAHRRTRRPGLRHPEGPGLHAARARRRAGPDGRRHPDRCRRGRPHRGTAPPEQARRPPGRGPCRGSLRPRGQHQRAALRPRPAADRGAGGARRVRAAAPEAQDAPVPLRLLGRQRPGDGGHPRQRGLRLPARRLRRPADLPGSASPRSSTSSPTITSSPTPTGRSSAARSCSRASSTGARTRRTASRSSIGSSPSSSPRRSRWSGTTTSWTRRSARSTSRTRRGSSTSAVRRAPGGARRTWPSATR
ncbi:hypothetical protein SALBM135S_06293 [Streptomyces alboniger]